MALEARALFPKAEIVSRDVAFKAQRRPRLGFPMEHGRQLAGRRLGTSREREGCSHLLYLQGGEMLCGMCGASYYFSKVVL